MMVSHALVAQLDRVPGYEPGGQRFESSPVQFLCSFINFLLAYSRPMRSCSVIEATQEPSSIHRWGRRKRSSIRQRRAELKIEKILLTHSHWDHFADVKVLKEKTGALLYVHPLDAKNVEQPGIGWHPPSCSRSRE